MALNCSQSRQRNYTDMVTPQTSGYFEVTGTLAQHPAAELVCEITAAGLSGSLRIENSPQKVILYFNRGKLVYAVSNARQHRLFDLLIRTGQVQKETIAQCKDIANDQALAAFLIERGTYNKEALPFIFAQQLREIVVHCIGWAEGSWVFNALARIREDVWQEFDVAQLLVEHSKSLPLSEVLQKVTGKESFVSTGQIPKVVSLSTAEYFVLSRLDQPSVADEITLLTGLSSEEIQKILYMLWLGGFIRRSSHQPAFTKEKIDQILSAEIKRVDAPKPVAKPVAPSPAQTEEPAGGGAVKDGLDIEEYLAQVENADTYYEVLGVFQNADIVEIKNKYFTFAKKFHPDKYHSEAGSDMHQRIQHAFTQISQSYETLKDSEAREIYNFKMRRQLEKLEKRKELMEEMKAQGTDPSVANEQELHRMEQASEEFDYGFDYLMNEDYAAAIPFFARAVKLAPEQGRYHAYYGKALAGYGKNRHQAEQEIQIAIKTEPDNLTYRLMLSEFYIDVNLLKRAEGELKKILARDPRNEDAQNLLNSFINNQA